MSAAAVLRFTSRALRRPSLPRVLTRHFHVNSDRFSSSNNAEVMNKVTTADAAKLDEIIRVLKRKEVLLEEIKDVVLENKLKRETYGRMLLLGGIVIGLPMYLKKRWWG